MTSSLFSRLNISQNTLILQKQFSKLISSYCITENTQVDIYKNIKNREFASSVEKEETEHFVKFISLFLIQK